MSGYPFNCETCGRFATAGSWAHLHVTGMKGIMEDVRDKLRSFLLGQGFNPWA